MWFESVSVNRYLISFGWVCKAFGEDTCSYTYRMTLRAAAAAAVAVCTNCYCSANEIRSITCCCCYCLLSLCYISTTDAGQDVCQMASHA